MVPVVIAAGQSVRDGCPETAESFMPGQELSLCIMSERESERAIRERETPEVNFVFTSLK